MSQRYAIIYEYPDGFDPFDLPSLLSRSPEQIPPVLHSHQMKLAAVQYIEMLETAHATGGRIEYLPPNRKEP